MALLGGRPGRVPFGCGMCGTVVGFMSEAKLRAAASFTPMRSKESDELISYVVDAAAITCSTCEHAQAVESRRQRS